MNTDATRIKTENSSVFIRVASVFIRGRFLLLRCSGKGGSGTSFAVSNGGPRGSACHNSAATPCTAPGGTGMSRNAASLLASAVCGLVAGCTGGNAYVPPPPPEVKVAAPTQQAVTIYAEFTGNTQASDVVQVQAQVQGYLES